MSNELQHTPIEQQSVTRVMDVLKKYERSFANVLPKTLSPERWRWLVVNNIRAVPALAQTSPMSFLNAVLLAANIGVEIRKNSAYLIPYGKECQLIIDYRGKLELARKAGVEEIVVELVHATDEFDAGFGITGRTFHHKPNYFHRGEDGIMRPVADRGPVVAGYAAAKLAHGWQIEIMTLEQIEKARKSGRGTDSPSSPWVKHWEEMARKTLVHRLCKYLPQSEKLVLAQDVDDAEAIGAPMPFAPELAEIEIDPADNLPMVDGGGDTREEQKASAQRVGALELERGKKGPPLTASQRERLEQARQYGRLDESLRKHGYTSISQVRQPDLDSLLAMAEDTAM